MRETGILSIVKRGPTLQVRYASFNPYDIDRVPYPCPNEGVLVTLMHHFGINGWSLQQAVTAVQRGEVAVLRVTLSEAQLQAYFPPQQPSRVGMDAEDVGGQAAPGATASAHACVSTHEGVFALPQLTAAGRDVRRSRAKAST
jgi:hypothetical protein